MKKRLAIVTTHPIQYNAPFFRLLGVNTKFKIRVFYTWGQSENSLYDPDFQQTRKWDIPLLEGYDHIFLKNIAKKPGSHHFFGINNPDLINEINTWAPDALLVYGWAFKSHLKAIRYFSKKVIVLFRGDSTLLDDKENGIFRVWVKDRFLKWVYSFVNFALYVGTENKKYFLKYGLKENQLVYAPHAIENERFYPTAENLKISLVIKKRLGIGDNEFVFLFAGKFQIKKNPLILISAFLKLKKKCHLIIVGNGKLEKEILANSRKHQNIHVMPFQNQSQMPALYLLCDVFVLPSSGPGETWGLALNESMASGKAIIATNKVGGAYDLIENYENGLMVSAGNTDELYDKLNFCLDNSEITKMWGNKNQKKIQDWNFERYVGSIEEIIYHK